MKFLRHDIRQETMNLQNYLRGSTYRQIPSTLFDDIMHTTNFLFSDLYVMTNTNLYDGVYVSTL